MLIPWLLLLVSIITGQEIDESADTRPNTTTLYPVTRTTLDIQRNYKNLTKIPQENNDIKTDVAKEDSDKENNVKDKVKVVSPKKEKVTTWTIDANYAPLNDKQGEAEHPINKHNQAIKIKPKDKVNQDSHSNDSNEQISVEKPKGTGEEKQFKPSPHLGSFFDDENLNLLKFATPDSIIYPGNKPTEGISGSKDFYALNYKSPKDTYRHQFDAPYRFEKAHFLTTNSWKQSLESKPTVESAVKIPAGGLYKHSVPFKDSPSLDADDDDFGLGFHEGEREKENFLKKRSNPWKSFLQLVTAFLPVGLIISALTPSVITLHSTDNDPYLSRGARRADAGAAAGATADVPAISEDCRRRLLCEIHSEENYVRSSAKSRIVRKHCYKLRCEAPRDLRRALAWLLAHGSAPRPAPRPPWPPASRPTLLPDHSRKNNDYT